MRSYRKNSHSQYDLKVHLIWIPKYRKRVLIGKVAERASDERILEFPMTNIKIPHF
ncbi:MULTISPECIES: transposase [spotted fever group]|uniref:transposase n=1 Tax=spotted fever group TaxID=114277 RepID=UPI0001A60957|nr:transposase [Rickettsia endosymbiont of Ixodes scapularis]EER22062.1 transposase family protein [Rickettsia endosymbiont of Ixodes scapularis]